jgi:hypothetical protein
MPDGDALRTANPFAEPVWEHEEDEVHTWEDTYLYRDWERSVVEGDNDYFIVVTASSFTSVSGSGKTTVQTCLGKSLDRDPNRDDGDPWGAQRKGTLDASEFAYDIVPNAPPKSALLFGEAQGLPGTDSLNSKRSMNQEAMDAISNILGNRDDQYTIILGAQLLSMLNKDLIPMIDAWLLIKKGPRHPNGPEVLHHKVYTNDYDLSETEPKTPIVEALTWPKIPHDDPDYQAMEQKKQEAKRKKTQEAVEEEDIKEPSEIADEIIRRDAVDAYVLGSAGGQYIAKELLADDYDLTNGEAKTVKGHLQRQVDIDVM